MMSYTVLWGFIINEHLFQVVAEGSGELSFYPGESSPLESVLRFMLLLLLTIHNHVVLWFSDALFTY